ncbi:carbohydrate-binding module family 13 protein [Peniophora sp. CONT]|nr:carbohydrate-binding module family 13 protein [Peniophora sp. CONT]
MSFSADSGVYYIEHAHVPVRMAMSTDSSNPSVPVVGWSVNDDILDHMWLITPVSGEKNTYHIRNLVTGTYMDLDRGSSGDGAAITGYYPWEPAENQKWIVKQVKEGIWKIQNKKSKTFADLLNGGSANGTKIVGWKGDWDYKSSDRQNWTFNRQSGIIDGDMKDIITYNQLIGQNVQSFAPNRIYLTLSKDRLREIWRYSGLQDNSSRRRPDVFDEDALSFVYKSEVAKWGNSQFKADRFTIFCGVIYGSDSQGGRCACNWVIKDRKIIFFDPSTGAFSDDAPFKGFSPSLAIF